MAEDKKTRRCSLCCQIKSVDAFPASTPDKFPFSAPVCFTCKVKQMPNEEDSGGSGGKQDEHSRGAKQLQWELELQHAFQKLAEQEKLKQQSKRLFQQNDKIAETQKNDTANRELLDKEEASPSNEEPAKTKEVLDVTTRKNAIVNRLWGAAYASAEQVTQNNKKAMAQKNINLFTQQATKANQKAEKITSANPLATESATLFAKQPHPSQEEVDQLTRAIDKTRKIFNK